MQMALSDLTVGETKRLLQDDLERGTPIEIVWTTDAVGEVRDDCPAWRAFTGQTFEEIERLGWLNAVHPDDRQRVRDNWFETVASGSVYDIDFRVRRVDGEWRHLCVRGVPVKENGQITRWVGFCRDVTESVNYMQLILRERDFSSAVIECLPGIFYITDNDGNILRWNKNAETISEYSPQEIAQRHGHDFIHPEHREIVIAKRKELHETGSYTEMEADFVTKSGKRIPLFINGRRIEFHGKQCMMGLGVDISKLKNAECELRELNTVLEDRVKQRTRQLEQSNKELESFSYTVSHDLRAPLQAIRGFTEILKEDYSAQLQGDAQEILQRILDAGERMGRLIDDVLRYSTTGRTALKFVTVPMTSLLRYVRNDFDLRLKEIGAELEFAPDLPSVKGDPTLLAQIFSNLFQNAINYRRKEVPLRLKVTANRENGKIVFSVSDNGVGIAPENREKVFQAFHRLQGHHHVPGTGLGLATVKKAVETMGGYVWIQSQLGHGSTFYIRLNAATEQTK